MTGLAASLTNGNTLTIVGLTDVAASTTFRLYGYGATATGGTGGFDVSTNVNNVVLNGSSAVASVPEPSAFLYGGAIVALVGGWSIRNRRRIENGLV